MSEKDNVVEAMYDFEAVEEGGLSFGKGDLIQVLNKLPSGWWDGVALKSKVRGWFPSNYVKVCCLLSAGTKLHFDRN